MIMEVPLMVQRIKLWLLDTTGPNPTGRVCAWRANVALGTFFGIWGVDGGLVQPVGVLASGSVEGSAIVTFSYVKIARPAPWLALWHSDSMSARNQ
jgi:hypothetical protein